ncbi:hypothetical protein OU798_22355 [Prolixibacteraceae bacterium Z1-6]|uniref:Uncharacterized protein n=1 Tax=Draconibacterium aestuarii TaxID=2998507 RepID=A0A9X3FB63_9BACT|nr:hypothetical protein [Prolixibacteraceae bacterium Z1-6]
MKTIILISSIFYILGLKISNKIDLIKKVTPVDKITIHTAKPEKAEKTIDFKTAQEEEPEKKDLTKEDSDIE